MEWICKCSKCEIGASESSPSISLIHHSNEQINNLDRLDDVINLAGKNNFECQRLEGIAKPCHGLVTVFLCNN